MVRWLRWHCPPDTGLEIRALAVWGRARYLSVTEAPHNTDFHTWMGKKHFCFFQTAETGNRTPNSGVKGSGANHYPRAPALYALEGLCLKLSVLFPSTVEKTEKYHRNRSNEALGSFFTTGYPDTRLNLITTKRDNQTWLLLRETGWLPQQLIL